ncbi:MAG TPA: hypothetical protein VFO40_03745 [Chthoniobacterales bacterium]|nr:hypothetical protein [Chthoniobacterales bacterium]
MRSPLITLFFLLALGIASFAAEIRKGATMEVKPNSIWFQDAAKLARWQQLKKSGNSKALASYQNDLLSNRDAWQFTKPLTVQILSYEPGKKQVNVEMKTPGRMLGSKWFLDTDALVQ